MPRPPLLSPHGGVFSSRTSSASPFDPFLQRWVLLDKDPGILQTRVEGCGHCPGESLSSLPHSLVKLGLGLPCQCICRSTEVARDLDAETPCSFLKQPGQLEGSYRRFRSRCTTRLRGTSCQNLVLSLQSLVELSCGLLHLLRGLL